MLLQIIKMLKTLLLKYRGLTISEEVHVDK